MNSISVTNLIVAAGQDFGSAVIIIFGAVLVIAGGFILFKVGWGYIRNMPGDWGYNSQRKSFRFGRGKSVAIPPGGRII